MKQNKSRDQKNQKLDKYRDLSPNGGITGPHGDELGFRAEDPREDSREDSKEDPEGAVSHRDVASFVKAQTIT